MPYLSWIPAAETDLPYEERSFDALLSGELLPNEAPADSRLVAELISALTAPTAADELAGFSGARAAYTTLFAPGSHGRALRWRPPMLDSLFRPKIAAALATGVLSLGGLGTAAYAGALPDTAQDVAHHVIGAPATHPGKGGSHAPEQGGAPTSAPAGPDATGPAAFGLCTAHAHANGRSTEGSAAFANLATAAGGADKIDAYCATIAHPGSSAAGHATGKPSAVPSHAVGMPSTVPARPTGKPSPMPSHPTGPPSSMPSHPTGPPSSMPSHRTGPPSTLPSHPTSHPTGKPSSMPSHPTGRPSTVPAPTSHPTGH
jgi:hypothetical protein